MKISVFLILINMPESFPIFFTNKGLFIMDVSIIIVNYNTCTLLRNCIRSIYDKTNGISFEILISDNNSSDGTSEMIFKEFPEVKFIENHKNLGFGAANNRALDIAS